MGGVMKELLKKKTFTLILKLKISTISQFLLSKNN